MATVCRRENIDDWEEPTPVKHSAAVILYEQNIITVLTASVTS